MKPKNKFQKQILASSKKLPKLSEAQIRWAYNNCIEHTGQRTKKGIISCLECGHKWTDTTTQKHCICPNCNTKLMIADTRQRVFNQYEYFCVITAFEGYQVLRFFYIQFDGKVGRVANYFHSEVVQRWIAPNGKYATLARLRPMGYFVNTWDFRSTLEIRPEKTLYNVTPTCVYPCQQIIPELKRSGYNKELYDLNPFDLFLLLLTENKAETLLKTEQIKLLQYFALSAVHTIDKYWASIRICIRNGYKPKDTSLWCDYINSLTFFGKDLHNAKYVCPADLKAEHDKYVKKKREWYEKQHKEEAKKKALENEAFFQEMKSKFFGIQFSDGQIQIKVLESVYEIMREGDMMHHCVFTNDYHLKPDSLILSACIEGNPVETIELSLSKLKVLQSRGICNQNSKYHNQILNLVEQHIPLIQKRISA